MSAWSQRHFSRPYLASTVECGERDGEIELRDGERSMTLSVDGDVEDARTLLQELRRPESGAWDLLSGQASAALVELVTGLDRMGWLREADLSGGRRCDERRTRLNQLLTRARDWLATAGVEQLRATASLPAEVLESCREIWRRTSPLTSRALAIVLDRQADSASSWDPVALSACDPEDVERQVWAALQLVVMSHSDALGSRYRRFVPPTVTDGPGVNVLVIAEACAEALLNELGEPELHSLIDAPGAAERVAPIVLQHRWFETIRYVDAAAGLLRFPLGASLRSLVAQYLSEEMGHEEHEAESCNQFGLSDFDLATFAPLAYFVAYPHLLGEMAEQRPLSFLLTVTVAEGLPGSGRRLTERLADSEGGASHVAEHDAIDRRLNHEMVTRTMASKLDWIDSASAAGAIAEFLRIVEMTYAGWQMVSRYVQAGLPVRLRPFQLSPDEVTELYRMGTRRH